MIHISRPKNSAPSVLIDPEKPGQKEKAANNTLADEGRWADLTFTAYKQSDVKQALISLFKSKCAYCESKFLHVYPGDIEHFRPMKEITGADPTRPGYYWLAAEWDNLFLSCRNCNQNLTHEVYGIVERRTMGKMNQFPLSDENMRVRSHNDQNRIQEEDDHCLLLNPCKDTPEDHLAFDRVHGIVRGISAKGETSINVFVLQRMQLVQARQKLLLDIHAQIQRTIEAVQNVNDNLSVSNPIRRKHFDRIMKREFVRLKKYIEPTEEYSGMARQVIRPFLNQNFGISI